MRCIGTNQLFQFELQEAYNNLRKILANRWDCVTMQAEEQVRRMDKFFFFKTAKHFKDAYDRLLQSPQWIFIQLDYSPLQKIIFQWLRSFVGVDI